MPNQTYRGPLWYSRAGVQVQAIDLAARNRRSDRKHKSASGALGCRPAKRKGAWYGIPAPATAAGLLFVGCILGGILALAMTA